MLRSRGEMDITAVFGTAIPGSNPGGSNIYELNCEREEVEKHFFFLVANNNGDGEVAKEFIAISPKFFLCGQGESNSRLYLGKVPFYH